MNKKIKIFTDGVAFLFYIFYTLCATYFLWSSSKIIVSSPSVAYPNLYLLSIVFFMFILILGFYFFTSYILSNSISLDSKGIFCRFYGHKYCARDYLFAPIISHFVPWDDVFLILTKSLNDIPSSFTCISKGELTNLLFHNKNLKMQHGSIFGNIPSFMIVLKNGRSRLVYTEPFSYLSVSRILKIIRSNGVLVVDPSVISSNSLNPQLLNQDKSEGIFG